MLAQRKQPQEPMAFRRIGYQRRPAQAAANSARVRCAHKPSSVNQAKESRRNFLKGYRLERLTFHVRH